MTEIDYRNMESDDLWSMANDVLTEIERRLEEDKVWSQEAEETSELLERIFLRDDEELYRMNISIEPNGFTLDWKAEDSGFIEDWRQTNGEPGVPDKALLKRNPILWLMNLKMGKYEAELV